MPTAQPGIDPPTDEVIALLCGDYLDHLNGSGGRSRAEIASIRLAPSAVRRLREALDHIDELHILATGVFRRRSSSTRFLVPIFAQILLASAVPAPPPVFIANDARLQSLATKYSIEIEIATVEFRVPWGFAEIRGRQPSQRALES